MGYRRRRQCESQIYHVMARGVGRMLLFEDDVDRSRYLSFLDDALSRYDLDVLAWCLMDNHIHLLVRALLQQAPRPCRPPLPGKICQQAHRGQRAPAHGRSLHPPEPNRVRCLRELPLFLEQLWCLPGAPSLCAKALRRDGGPWASGERGRVSSVSRAAWELVCGEGAPSSNVVDEHGGGRSRASWRLVRGGHRGGAPA